MIKGLKNHHAGAFAHHKTIAVLVVRTRRLLRLVIKIGGKRLAGCKSGHGQTVDRRLRAPRQHHIGITQRHETGCIANGMRTGRTRRHHSVVRPLEAKFNGNITRRHIDDASGNEKRRNPTGPFFNQRHRGIINAADPANARTDHHTGPDLILIGLGMPIRIIEGLTSRRHAVNDEIIDLALVLRVHPLIGVEKPLSLVSRWDLEGNARWQVRDVEPVNRHSPALSRQ
jgi:hypothetical protein